jgi:hypothetical protein
MPKLSGNAPAKKKNAKSPAKKKKIQAPPPTKTEFSPFTTAENMLASLEAKCALGDLEALAFALEILAASTEPAPAWLIRALTKIVNELLGNTVVGKGPRGTRKGIVNRNRTDLRRYVILQRVIADGAAKGKTIPMERAYQLAEPDLIAAKIFAGWRATQDSCLRIESLLKQSSFSPARDFAVEPEVFFQLVGIDAQE